MGTVLSKGTLFPEVLTNEMFNLVRGKSSLARLSNSAPIPFNGARVFTFNFDNEVNLVAENGAKANGGGAVAPVSMVPVKVEYGMRVSDEFRFAAEEARIEYLRAFAEGFSAKLARGLDIMAMHGINPRTGLTASTLSNKNFDDLVTQTVTYAAATADANVDAAVALVEGNEHEVTGMAMSPIFRAALAALKKGTNSNEPLFPELAWGSNPGVIRGLGVDTNATVSFNSSLDRAVVGNFRDYFRWGYARGINIEVIEYGNPDNDAEAGDLKGHNQVYLRGEAYLGWGIIAPAAFARIAASST
jgi:HK97 family phage major capsid protein